MAFPNQIQGMNRMMYVEGNPVSLNDPSGHCPGACKNEDALLFSILLLLSQGKSTLSFPDSPGHNYSGSGNVDFKFFNKLFNKDPNQRLNAYALMGGVYLFMKIAGFNDENIGFAFGATLLIANQLRVKPKGVMDKVSQRHDDSAPTGLGEFGNYNDDRYHSTGAGEFVRGGLESLSYLGKWNVGDIGAFVVGMPLYSFYAGLRGTMYNIKSMNIRNVHQKLPDALGNLAVVGMALSGNPLAFVGASFIGRSPLKNSEKNIKRAFKVKGGIKL